MRLLSPLNLNEQEKYRLEQIINNNDEDYKKKQCCEVIYYYDQLLDINSVINITGAKRRTIFNYLKKYREDRFFMNKFKNKSKLNIYKNNIVKDFKNNPIKTYSDAKTRIKKITGLELSLTQIYYFLINNGFKKNNNGYYTKNGIMNNKIKNSYLYEHLEEIGNYINDNPSSESHIIINRIRNRFPEVEESDYEILQALNDYLPF